MSHNIHQELQNVAILDISTLTLNPQNARKHPQRSVDVLCSSLRKFGQRKPLTVTQEGVILSGEGLYRAARKLGWTEIAAIVVNDDTQDATQWGIVDNRSAEVSAWDWQQLSDSLQELSDMSVNLDDMGFEESEIEAIFGSVSEKKSSDGDSMRGPKEKRPVVCPQCQCEFVPE